MGEERRRASLLVRSRPRLHHLGVRGRRLRPVGRSGRRILGALTVEVRNSGHRPGREVVQAYLSDADLGPGQGADVERPTRWLFGFAAADAAPGETVRVTIPLPRRAAQVWNDDEDAWQLLPGRYVIEAGRSLADRRVQVIVPVHDIRPAGESVR
ncbi:fibronectin type III-like domain-contianing protein [Streptomyces sp. NPDC048248]|uniref:fibronectin type III-like domain-contianing protein n=1 Tax=Streptomyces sp. NPDC048248 TaxID=3365523 RepID=UPI003724ACA2